MGAPRDPARARRPHPHRVRQDHRLRLLLPATTSSSRRSSGLAGPWISGGVEFNWPQHHRPATFLPVETDVEHADDGCGHGVVHRPRPVRAHAGHARHPPAPGSSTLIELEVRLLNRTRRRADVPVVGERRGRVARRTTSRSSRPTCATSPTTRSARDHRVPARPTARTTASTTRALARGRGRMRTASTVYRNIPVPTSYMITDTAGRLLRRLRPRRAAPASCTGPTGAIAARQEAVDLGRRRVRPRLGSPPDRRRRPLRRADGRASSPTTSPTSAGSRPGETRTGSRQYWYPIAGHRPGRAGQRSRRRSASRRDGTSRRARRGHDRRAR